MKRKYVDMEEKMEERKQFDIPDISLQLIFCFLYLKELPVIAQCCKRWYKLVTENFFFKLYGMTDISLDFQENNFPLFCLSPFRHLLNTLIFHDQANNNISFIPQFSQLRSLEFKISFNTQQNRETDYLSTFISFPPSLRILKIYITDSFDYAAPLAKLLHAVSHAKQIEEFYIENDNDESEIDDFTFISHLINLKKLTINCKFNLVARNSLFVVLSSLPKLTAYHSTFRFVPDGILTSLRLLLSSSLTCLPGFVNIHIDDQLEFAHLLNQLPCLKDIEYGCTGDHPMQLPRPHALAQRVGYLFITDRVFTDDDVDSIISMKELYQISFSCCSMTGMQFRRICNGIGKQLQYLRFDRIQINCHDLFEHLSKCTQLYNLELNFFIEDHVEYAMNLFQLRSCTNLKKLVIKIHDNAESSCSQLFKQALTLPCALIPSLQKIRIKHI
jgi:hypothetical protein